MMTGENEDRITYVLSDVDRMCTVARSAYGIDGAVLLTPNEGVLQPEVAEIPRTSYDQQSSGSTTLH